MTDAIQPTGSTTPPADTTPPVGAPVTPPPSPPPGMFGAAATPPADPAERIKHLEAELAKTRTEAAGYRTQNKGELAEFKKQLAALAGGTPDAPGPSDPASILAQIQKERADEKQEIRRLKVDLALNDVYQKVGVKAKTTRSLLETEGLLSGLNPDDAEFPKSLHAAVKKLADEYPELKTAQATAPTAIRSSAPFPGGNNAPPQLTREDLKGMSAEEINTAREKGQLNQVLNRR
jgi:ribosomal protein L29